jgi:aminoglycoside 2'-N-acetyltransferase I
LWADAFGDRFTDDDADHAYGGVHVMAYDGTALVGHASAVPRKMRFGDQWHTVGYVEAVATLTERQGAGIGLAVMGALHNEMQHRWSVGVLSTGLARGFYERLGWVPWEGTSYVLTERGEVRTEDEDAGLMVRTFDGTPPIDLTTSITCENRSGDAW